MSGSGNWNPSQRRPAPRARAPPWQARPAPDPWAAHPRRGASRAACPDRVRRSPPRHGVNAVGPGHSWRRCDVDEILREIAEAWLRVLSPASSTDHAVEGVVDPGGFRRRRTSEALAAESKRSGRRSRRAGWGLGPDDLGVVVGGGVDAAVEGFDELGDGLLEGGKLALWQGLGGRKLQGEGVDVAAVLDDLEVEVRAGGP